MKKEDKKTNVLPLIFSSAVEPDELFDYISSKIDFNLSDDIWTDINNGYAEFYNSLPSYAYFNEDEAFEYMTGYLKREKMIFPVKELRLIHRYIFEFLVERGNISSCD